MCRPRACAGFQHETNTFGATRAEFRDFEQADAWPGLLRGAAVISDTAGVNVPALSDCRPNTVARTLRDEVDKNKRPRP